MNILAVHRDGRNDISGCIAELSSQEMAAILGMSMMSGRDRDRICPGAKVTVIERMQRVSQIEGNIQDAVNVAEQLRVLADMIETAIPALEKMVTVDKEPVVL